MLTRRRFLLTSAASLAFEPLLAERARAASRLSFKLFDGHCHLKSQDLQRYPRSNAGPPPGGGPSTPGAPGSPPPSFGTARPTPVVEDVLRWMDENGVEGIAAVQHRGTYGYDNSYILDSSDHYPARLAPVVVLNAEDSKTPDAVRAMVKNHGLAGVRLTGMRATDGGFPWLNSQQALTTWAVANESGLVIDLMTSPPGRSPAAIEQFLVLAQSYPRVRMVLDHVAWPNAEGPSDYGLDAGYRSLATRKNIYYKFSTINLDMLQAAKVDAPDMLRHVVDVFGADHVLWGSDLGNSGGTYQEMVTRIVAASAKLSDSQKRQVLHDTGKSVFVRGGHSA